MPYILGQGWVDDAAPAAPQSLSQILSSVTTAAPTLTGGPVSSNDPNAKAKLAIYGAGAGFDGLSNDFKIPGDSAKSGGGMEWLNDAGGNGLATWLPGQGWVAGQNWSHANGDKLSRTNLQELSSDYYAKGRDAQIANTGQYVLGSVGGSSDPYFRSFDPSSLNTAGMTPQQKVLFDPNSNYGSAGYNVWGSGTDPNVGRPTAKYDAKAPEETILQQLAGGANSPGIWAPSPLGMFTAGAGGFLAGAGALAAGAGAAEGGAAAGGLTEGVGAIGSGFEAGGLGAGFDATGALGGAGADAWGVNPRGDGMNLNDIIEQTGNFTGGDPTIPNTEWPTQNMWNTGPAAPPGPPMVSWDGAPPVPFNPTDLYQKAVQKLGETGAKTLLSKLFSGDATADDYVKILGQLGATGLGLLGANNQAKSLADLAAKYQEYGAPSRGRYEASMKPGFDPTTIPGYAGALDSTSQAILRKLSTQGNPYGSPGGLIEANKAIVSGTALPAINEYQRLNANTGFGSSMNAALGLQTQGIGADKNIYDALGYGLGQLTAPPKTDLASLLKSLQMGGLA